MKYWLPSGGASHPSSWRSPRSCSRSSVTTWKARSSVQAAPTPGSRRRTKISTETRSADSDMSTRSNEPHDAALGIGTRTCSWRPCAGSASLQSERSTTSVADGDGDGVPACRCPSEDQGLTVPHATRRTLSARSIERRRGDIISLSLLGDDTAPTVRREDASNRSMAAHSLTSEEGLRSRAGLGWRWLDGPSCGPDPEGSVVPVGSPPTTQSVR